MTLRILVTGADGQVGWELARTLLPLGEVVALGRSECDLADARALAATLDRVKPDVICNAAAYTAVDRAEAEEDIAHRVNAEAVGEIGRWAAASGAVILHYSTDYVFDGTASRPYREDDIPSPQSAYGRSKLAGEQLLAASGAAALTCRTSWVYAMRGHNFARTMLRLAREREVVRVVADQRGSPTWARWLAEASGQLLVAVHRSAEGPISAMTSIGGILHLSAGGETSWHGFAEQILANDPTPSEHRARKIERISTSEYPTPAQRPAYSVLDGARAEALGIARGNWEAHLKLALGVTA